MNFWGNSTKPKAESKFFAGLTAVKKAIKSKFGKAKEIVELTLGKEEMKNFKMPSVIVMGDESTGKSSLLENLTKCPFLPRDSDICTKCPVYIKLSESESPIYTVEFKGKIVSLPKNNIAKQVMYYMNSIPDRTIVSDEIIVSISEPGLASFEYYDLPGLRAYPEDLREATEALCEKYLAMDCIVLCVIPATNTRLTASRSLGLIKKHNKCDDTIISLTMIDRINNNMENLLINRILCIGSEFNDLSVFGCVGVINRDHADTVSLEDNNTTEIQWLEDNFNKYNMPKKFTTKKVYKKISSNIGSECLIERLDTLYNKFIHENWKPKLEIQLHDKIAAIEQEAREVGDNIPESIIVMSLMDCIKSTRDDKETMFKYSDNPFNYTGKSENSVDEYLEVKYEFKEYVSKLKNHAASIKISRVNSELVGVYINSDRFRKLRQAVNRLLRNFAISIIEEFEAKLDYYIDKCTPLIEYESEEFCDNLRHTVEFNIYKMFESQILNICYNNFGCLDTGECLRVMCEEFKKDPTLSDYTSMYQDRANYVEKYGTPAMKNNNLFKFFIDNSGGELFEESDETKVIREEITTRFDIATDRLEKVINDL